MRGLVLILVFSSGIALAQAQERIWLNKKFEWVADSTQATRYAIVSKTEKDLIKVEEFTPDGQKKEIWHFSKYGKTSRKRTKEGLHTTFYASGKDSLVEVFKANRREGQAMVYYPDGSTRFAKSFKNGRLNGRFLQYYPNGKLRREESYSDGSCIGGKLFSEDGNKLEHQPYWVSPEFQGGIENLRTLVANVVKYPKEALKKRTEGLTVIQFIVGEDGSMLSPKIIKPVSQDIDKEALRAFTAIAMAYKWTPGYQDGKAQRIKFTIPLNFRLSK